MLYRRDLLRASTPDEERYGAKVDTTKCETKCKRKRKGPPQSSFGHAVLPDRWPKSSVHISKLVQRQIEGRHRIAHVAEAPSPAPPCRPAPLLPAARLLSAEAASRSVAFAFSFAFASAALAASAAAVALARRSSRSFSCRSHCRRWTPAASCRCSAVRRYSIASSSSAGSHLKHPLRSLRYRWCSDWHTGVVEMGQVLTGKVAMGQSC